MTIKKSAKRVFGLISVALTASILMQWLIIPKIQWNYGVSAAGESFPQNYDSTSSINYSTILGGAVDYGIVSNRLVQLDHSETTFATNEFVHCASNVDPDFIDHTALFIIDSLAASGTEYTDIQGETHTADGLVVFGKTTASSLYIEAENSVFGDGFSTANCLAGHTTGNIQFDTSYNNAPVAQEAYTGIPGGDPNVNRLINRISGADGRSVFLNQRATTDYALNYNGNLDFFTDQNGTPLSGDHPFDNIDKLKINLDYDEFENRVVYINITPEMLPFVTADLNKLYITKRASTTVVLNIAPEVSLDNLILRGAHLIVVDGNGNTIYEKENGETSKQGNRTDVNGRPITDTETYYNERIIWNVMSSGDIRLHNMAGVMLFPNATNVRLHEGNFSGWLVTGGSVENSKEFHFIYDSGVTNVPGQMHFAILKGFTTAYAPKSDNSPVPVTTLNINDGDFCFYIQEVASWASTSPYVDPDTGVPAARDRALVDSNSSALFSTITFSTGTAANTDHFYIQTPLDTDPQEYNAKTYYYRVYEDPNVGIGGVSNSNGYIDIELQVRVDKAGNFAYLIKYKSYTGDGILYEDRTNNTGASAVDGYILMTGVQFDLGTFFNKVNNTLTITKTISGDYVVPAGGDSYQFAVYTEEGGNRTWYNADGTTSPTEVFVEVTVPEGETTASISIPGLPDGTYHVDEVAASAEVAGYDLDSGSHTTTATISATTPVAQASINNDYTKQYNLAVTKVLSGSGASSIDPDAEFDFTITNGTQFVQADGSLGNDPYTFSVKVGDELKLNVPAGSYQIIEDTTVAESYATGSIVFDLTASKTTVDVSPSTPSSPVTGKLENVYNDSSIGSISITKTVRGATLTYTSFTLYLTYVDNNTTYYIYNDNGVWKSTQWWQPSITILPGQTLDISGDFIVADRTYTLTENSPDAESEGHTYTSTTINGVSGLTSDIGLTSTNLNGSFNIINYYDGATPSEGSIEINKTITLASGVSLTDIGTITFEVRNGSTVVETINLDPNNLGSGWTKTGDVYSYTVTGLTAGTVYTVVETSTGEQGTVVLDTTASDTSDKTPTASDATTLPDSAKASFTNTYTSTTATYGYIKVVKTLSGITLDLAGDINFTVTGVDGITIPTLNREAVRTGVWTESGSTYTYVIPTRIATGTEVTVTETAPTSPITAGDTTYTITAAPAPVTITIAEGTQ
ncbi:MAG: hypothetical protein J6O00_07925, partial [Clostridiales bacterium]|nr:hypothetical protein [Clostridiales bacterium]